MSTPTAVPPPHSPIDKVRTSPLLIRVAPFVAFLVLTSLQGQLGDHSRYWLYLVKTIAGIGFIWMMRPLVSEMRWAFSWEAAVAGIAVFGIWVGLDPFYPKLAQSGEAWNPFDAFGAGSGLAWIFVVTRIFGSTLIVPALEEVFYRSFLYRYIAKPDFMSMPLGLFSWKPFLITAIIFGLAHPQQWIAGILCGLIYQWLVIRKNRLGDAITAHAITNFLLGAWVVWKGAWHFW